MWIKENKTGLGAISKRSCRLHFSRSACFANKNTRQLGLINMISSSFVNKRGHSKYIYKLNFIVPKKAVTSFVLFAALLSFFSLSGTNNASAVGSVTLTVSNSTVDLNIAPTNTNGTFAKSENVNISASTDNSTGYTLAISASSSTDYNKLKNGNYYLTSVSEPTTEESFKALNGTAYNGKWGYLPSKHHSQANTDFLPAPTLGGDILDKTDSANSTANNYTLAIGARVDSSVKVGSYVNTYNVILVANEVPYTITYHDNIITNMPVDVSSASSASTVNISSNTPTRAGYSFLGWCTVVPTNNNGTDTCTGGTQYAPGASWTLGASNNDLDLYAMWGESIGQCASKDTCMQFMDRYKLSTLMPTVGSTATLYDMRDGQAYTVALLADSKYWMTKNLNLAGGTALSSTDTDMPDGYTLPTANGFGANNTLPASDNTGFGDNIMAYVYNTGKNTDTCTSPGCYSYYSWTAATLGSGLSISTENTDAPYSICPKGWRLPTSGKSSNNGWKRGDFYQLATTYGANLSSNYYQSAATFYNNAGPGTTPNFLLAGGYVGGSFGAGGDWGGYWSSTSYSDAGGARYFAFGPSYVASTNDSGRAMGWPVRCLFGS